MSPTSVLSREEEIESSFLQDNHDRPISENPFPSEDNSSPVVDHPIREVYSIFTRRQIRMISFFLSITNLASPLSATIYFPLLPLLATHFNTTLQAINLTITVYVIFQAISPFVFGTASDTIGRRPLLLFTFALYALASLGLALNTSSYAALIVLRAVQSLGASSMQALSYGVIADVCVPAERGSMQAFFLMMANLATCVGPVVGGWIAFGSGNYQWVFWALVIYSGAVLTVVGLFFPETARSIVGNGSLETRKWRWTWWRQLTNWHQRRRKHSVVVEESPGDQVAEVGRKRFRIPNPMACIRILFWKDTFVTLWTASTPYAVWYCIQAGISPIFKDDYGFNELQVGLCYLSGAAGVVLGCYSNGQIMDWNYRVTARQIGHQVDRVYGDDLKYLPIEQARSRGYWYVVAVYSTTLCGYGWAVQKHAHEACPLILQFVLGILVTWYQQTFNALLVDIFPASPSTASATSSIVRCALSAIGVAIMQPLVGSIGRGWFFTILTVVSGGGNLLAQIGITCYGMEWRAQRMLRTTSKVVELRAFGMSDADKNTEHGTSAVSVPPALAGTTSSGDVRAESAILGKETSAMGLSDIGESEKLSRA